MVKIITSPVAIFFFCGYEVITGVMYDETYGVISYEVIMRNLRAPILALQKLWGHINLTWVISVALTSSHI